MEERQATPTLAKVTAKGQITIPPGIRAALRVGPGDLIAWEIAADGQAMVRRVQPLDADYLRAVQSTLSEEWSGAADDAAYRDL